MLDWLIVLRFHATLGSPTKRSQTGMREEKVSKKAAAAKVMDGNGKEMYTYRRRRK